VEDERGVPVELVMVGDCDTTESIHSLVRAAREAMVNGAKHSGADKIDVFAEVDEDTVEVFVRDRGKGFDVDGVADDRMGVKGSIIDRMARHGGNATVRPAPGDGTEVRLEIKRCTRLRTRAADWGPPASPMPRARASNTGRTVS